MFLFVCTWCMHSVCMVCLWACGDSFKTSYFVARGSPAQFVLCGVLQLFIDALIFAQIALYSQSAANADDAADEHRTCCRSAIDISISI